MSLETGNTEFVDAEERTDAQETGKPLYENTITTIKKKQNLKWKSNIPSLKAYVSKWDTA